MGKKEVSKTTSVILIILFAVSVIVSIRNRVILRSETDLQMKTGSTPRLLFCIMTHRSSVHRAIQFHERFGEIIKQSSIYDGPVYISAPPHLLPNMTVLPLDSTSVGTFFTYPLVKTKIGNIDLTIKFLTVLRYFIEETDDDYVIRATDDVFINFEKLPLLLHEIRKQGDPRTTPIIVGQCMHVRGRTLLQGGSGYLISRKAAEILLLEGDQLVASVDIYEDWVIYSFFQRVVRNPIDTFSPRFLGHGFSKTDWELLLKKNFSMFPPCPRKFWSVGCKEILYPLSDTVFFHQFGYEPGYDKWMSAIKDVPPNLMWYQSWYYSRLCIKSNKWLDEESVPANKADAIDGNTNRVFN